METNIFSRFKAALIDMDGVLYDSMPGHTLAWKKMMEGVGVECTRDEFYLYEGMTGVATVNLLFERAFGHGCSREEAMRLYEIKSRYFKELGPARLMPGSDRMLTALKSGGLARVLVTGSAQKSLLERLDSDYTGIFDEDKRVTALDVAHGKPHPEPYLKGAEKARVDPAEAIVIENAPLGVRAAKAAGCFAIAVTTGPIPRDEFEKEGADMIFQSMESFAQFMENQLFGYLLEKSLCKLNADRIFVLTDKNVRENLHPDLSFADSVKEVQPGEQSKNIETLCDIWEWLVDGGATRRSVLINLGGGVVTDLGGFAAATFKRGIRFLNVPTTILGAADAAIGGKTGIDFKGLKNEIGAFAMPEDVIIIPHLFSTLTDIEKVSGFAEVVKMALLNDGALYERLLDGDALTDGALMDEAIRHAAACKEEIVRLDPKETGLRRILNFGHTAGHAFESYSIEIGTPLSHGEAVAHGILTALTLSVAHVGLHPEVVSTYKERILDRYYKKLPFGPEAAERLVELMKHDKKNLSTDAVSFVLLRSPGTPIESTMINHQELSEVLGMSLDF